MATRGDRPGWGMDRHLRSLMELADGYQRHRWQARSLGDREVNRFLERALTQIRDDSDRLARWLSTRSRVPGGDSHRLLWLADEEDPELQLRLMLALDAARERQLLRSVHRSLDRKGVRDDARSVRLLRGILGRSRARQRWLLRRVKGGTARRGGREPGE